jgi:hypothetical protein
MKDKERDKDKRLFLPDDEFGEEASEGLGRLNRDEAAGDLHELKGRLRRRVSKPRHIWLQAAAALVVLLIASTVVIYVFREKGIAGTQLAKSEEAVIDTALIAMAEPIQKQEKGYISTEKKGKGETFARAKGTEPAMPVAGTEKAVARSGQAKQPSEKAAAIAVKDTDMVMEMAEANDEKAVAEEVIVEAVPMMQRTAMREGEADKKEAAGKAAARPVTAMPDRQAAPVGGWEEFNKWTRPNISLPGDVKPNVSRVVVVTFKVRADSTLYDLKVVRSADDSFSQEALRMLREGPKWVPAVLDGKVVDKEVTVSIIFK